MKKNNNFINEEAMVSCDYEYVDITHKKTYDSMTDLIEGLSLSDLETCKIYCRSKLFEFIMDDYIPASKKDKQEYFIRLLMISGVLAKIESVSDKKYNELSDSEKREYLINTFQMQMNQYIKGRLR